MLATIDPWRRPHRPEPGDAGGSVVTTTAYRPGLHIPLPPAPAAAGWARRRGAEPLRARGLDPGVLDVVSLLITELVTNALLHGLRAAAAMDSAARCPRCGSQLCLNLREEPGAVLIEVFDAAPVPPRRMEEARRERARGAGTRLGEEGAGLQGGTAAGHAERGRGLLLVSGMSEEQGYYLPPAGGKIVWCVVKAGDWNGTV